MAHSRALKILSFLLFFFILITPISYAEKIYDIYTSFNAGELSPLLEGQVNFDKYKSGAKTMTNFFPHVQGPISNRSGFKYVAEVKTSAKKTRLIPFEFSKEQAYIIEMGDQYFRFYMNGGQIQSIDANTMLYLRMNGDDASTTFTDESPTIHTVTANGNAQIDTAEKKFGTASGLFDGTGDYLTVGDHADFDFSGGTFTIDTWVYINDLTNHQEVYYQETGSLSDSFGLEIYNDGSIGGFLYIGGVSKISLTTTTGLITAGQWYHIAFVRDDSDDTWYIFVDGVEKASSVDTDNPANYTSLVYIGRQNGITSRDFDGWIDEFRVSDTARWTSDFTPPTLEYIVNEGGIYEVAHTYTEDELFDVQYTQSADTLYLVHPNHVPAKLERTGHAAWTLTDLPFTKTNLDPTSGEITNSGFSAFSATNLVDGKVVNTAFDGDTAAANSYIRINLGSGGDLTYVGARFYTETSGAFITFDVKYSDDGSSWTNTTATGWDLSDGAGWHKVSWDDAGAHRYWRFNKTNAAQEGGDVTELEMFIDSLPSTWGTGSYPSSITFFENRLWYGYLQTVWASKTGDYYNLTFGADPDSAMEYTLLSNQINAIQWMSPGKVLVIGTTGGEYKVSASNQEEAITPLNIRIVKQSSYGSAAIQPVTIRDVTLYVQKNNRKVREFTYSWERDTYVSPDLTALAEHITNSGIKEIAYQSEPYSMLWCVKNNGDIAALTYDREAGRDTVAWTNQTTTGDFKSVATIPGIAGNDYDEVWVIVQRTINGSSVRYIELLQPQFDHNDSIEDAFFVDSGLSYDGVSTSSVSGLDHLEGETVSVLADGVVFDDAVVTSGAITLKLATVTTPATKVHAGLPYTSTYQSMRHEAKDIKGTTQGRTKRINKAVFRVHNTLQYQYGYTPSGDFRTQTYTSMTSGDKELDLPRTMAPANYGYITVKNAEPTPITIIAIIVEVNVLE